MISAPCDNCGHSFAYHQTITIAEGWRRCAAMITKTRRCRCEKFTRK